MAVSEAKPPVNGLLRSKVVVCRTPKIGRSAVFPTTGGIKVDLDDGAEKRTEKSETEPAYGESDVTYELPVLEP